MTGGTGMVGGPIAQALAAENEVWCLARFNDEGAKVALEALGVQTVPWQLGVTDLDGLRRDFTHVVHTTANTGLGEPSWQHVIDVNATGTGMLMSHCRGAEAFLFVSFTAVYSPQSPDHIYAESDPIGGHTPWLPVYGVSKVATEATVRAFSTTLGLPVTIGRLGVVHGPLGWGGTAVRYFRMMQAGETIKIGSEGHENRMQPIHTDDIARQVPLLLDVATVPGTIVNWAGDESVGERELFSYITEITGVEAKLEESEAPLRTQTLVDNTLRRQLIGDCRIGWREGVSLALASHFPGVQKARAEG